MGLMIGNDLNTERKRRKILEDFERLFLFDGCSRVIGGDLMGDTWLDEGETIRGVAETIRGVAETIRGERGGGGDGIDDGLGDCGCSDSMKGFLVLGVWEEGRAVPIGIVALGGWYELVGWSI